MTHARSLLMSASALFLAASAACLVCSLVAFISDSWPLITFHWYKRIKTCAKAITAIAPVLRAVRVLRLSLCMAGQSIRHPGVLTALTPAAPDSFMAEHRREH